MLLLLHLQSITCRKHVSDCGNHSPCFIHTLSAIKHTAKNANEPALTGLMVWMDVAVHPPTYTQKLFSLFHQNIHVAIQRLGIWNLIIFTHASPWWRTSSSPPCRAKQHLYFVLNLGRCAKNQTLAFSALAKTGKLN